MYCVQCEQTMRTPVGNGCAYAQGMCGKTAETSDLQDLLVAVLESLSAWAVAARESGIIDHDTDSFAPRAFFSTLTNVNFDSERIIGYAQEAIVMRDSLMKRCLAKNPALVLNHPLANLQLKGTDIASLVKQADEFALNKDKQAIGDDIHGLRMLCLYGLKGAAAYMEHAHVLGKYSDEIYGQYHEIMAWLGTDPSDMGELLNQSMAIGMMNFKIMEMLDAGETEAYGHPTPSSVNVRPVAGKAILISGHDLKDLHMLLQQTEGTGVNVYTHGEMLPAHGYPELKKYKHLVGNYGSGWQNQQTEFAKFEHLITVGFGRETLLNAADTVIDLVATGKLRHVFLVGGCDGSRGERSYYTDFARQVPQDCLIMTLACGKYRFNKLDFGTLEGLPRLLDVGQCNDAYSAIMLAVKLAEKLGCGVNDLPLTLVLSWFEQKAIVILLTLLALGVKDIFTGPTAPAFLTDNLLNVLNEKFGMRPITTVENDLHAVLGA